MQVRTKAKDCLNVQMNAWWFFVDDKGNKQWVGLALDIKTREIVGDHVGDRDQESAFALWQFRSGIYRQCAVLDTDYWEADQAVRPSQCHHAVGKETGLTSDLERFHNTLRQRGSRLGRQT